VYYPAPSGLSSLFLSSFVSLLWQPTLVFKIAPIHFLCDFQTSVSVFINTVLPLWGKRIKLKKKKNKGDKINLLSNKMQYQECHGNLTIFVKRHA
jgi:hypothetical protein